MLAVRSAIRKQCSRSLTALEAVTPSNASSLYNHCSPASSNNNIRRRFSSDNSVEVRIDAESTPTIANNKRRNPWSGTSLAALEQETIRLQKHLQEKRPTSTSIETATIIRLDDYFDVLEAWMEQAKGGVGIRAAQRAESLLQTMQFSSNKNAATMLAPSLSFYEVVLQAYAVSNGGSEAALQTQSILQYLVENQQPQSRVVPTTKTYNIVLNAWAKAKVPDAGFHADLILQTMMKAPKASPNVITIATVMDAWNKSGHPNASQRAMELLEETLEQQQQSFGRNDSPEEIAIPSTHTIHNKIKPTIVLFHVVMDTVVKNTKLNRSSNNSNSNNKRWTARKAAEYVEHLLQAIIDKSQLWDIQPNVYTFSLVLEAWARVERMEQSGNAAQRAQNLLDLMLESYYNPNHTNNAIPAVKPNAVSFTSVMNAWSHAKQAQKAQDAFQRLFNLHEKDESDPELVPTIIAGNSVMAAWAKEGRPDFILQVIQTMQQLAATAAVSTEKDCQPNLQSFNILLDAYCRAGKIPEAVSLLKWMEGDNNEPIHARLGVSLTRPDDKNHWEGPDLISYNSMMRGFAHDGNVQGAEALIAHMQQQERGITPTQVTWTSLFNAYARSNDPNKVQKAHGIWKDKISAPDVVCTVAFLQVCSRAGVAERKMALDLALKVFAAMPRQKRNHVAFLTMAQAMNNLLKEDNADNVTNRSRKKGVSEARSALLKELCQQCCAGGVLSNNVHREFNKVRWDSQDVVLAWLESKTYQPDWSRNVPARDRPKAFTEQTRRGHR